MGRRAVVRSASVYSQQLMRLIELIPQTPGIAPDVAKRVVARLIEAQTELIPAVAALGEDGPLK